MSWEYIGTGLAVAGIGVTLVLALPPPWWLKMPPKLVHAGVFCGLVLTLIGAAILTAGVWPNLPTAKTGPIILLVLGAMFLIAGGCWLRFGTFSNETTPNIPISISLIDSVTYFHRTNFTDTYQDDTPSFTTKEVYISNLANRQVALRLFLHVNGIMKEPMVIEGDAKDPFARVRGINDWGSQLTRKLMADPPNYLRSPLILQPLQTVHGILTFVFPFGPNGDINDPKNVLNELRISLFKRFIEGQEKVDATLEVRDEVSGVTITMPIPGKYHGIEDQAH
jgi:hypothetical protein